MKLVTDSQALCGETRKLNSSFCVKKTDAQLDPSSQRYIFNALRTEI